MFAYRLRHYKGQPIRVPRVATAALIALAALMLLAAGCGGDDDGAATSAQTDAAAGDAEVIKAWSAALTEGDVEAAADLFAIPSTAQNGPLTIRIETAADAIAFNESLPCGSKVISTRTEGDFTSATFRLEQRPGADCGTGVGETASTSFQIEDGKIIEWRRIDELPPGEGGPPEGGGGAPV